MAARVAIGFFLAALCLYAATIKDIYVQADSKNREFEVITYANGKQEVSWLKKGKSPYFTPETSPLRLTITPKVLHNTRFGTIYLYDLAQPHSYLNVLPYDTMEIEGNLTHMSLGLADIHYYEKEDHLKLPLQHRFRLKDFFKKIDLCRLKYLVVLSPNSAPPSIEQIVFKKESTKSPFQKHPLETWAWNPEHVTAESLKHIALSRMYLQMKKGFSEALEQVKHTHITLYGLNGSPEDILHYDHLIKDIQTLGELKKKYPFIRGYQIDVEPYLLEQYKKNKNTILRQYLEMLHTLKKHTSRYGLKLSVVIPFWFDHLYINGKNLGFSVIDTADEVVLMSYRSSLDKVVQISRTLLEYASLARKEMRLGIELMKIDDEQHTVYRIIQRDAVCLTSEQLSDSCLILKKIRHYTVRGDSISFYGQTGKLQHITEYPVSAPSFKGFVFHHFDLLSTLPEFSTREP